MMETELDFVDLTTLLFRVFNFHNNLMTSVRVPIKPYIPVFFISDIPSSADSKQTSKDKVQKSKSFISDFI